MAEKMITSSRSAVFAAGLLCLLRLVRQVCFVYCGRRSSSALPIAAKGRSRTLDMGLAPDFP